jgi:predicted nucleic-acid-binding Zn-ribbon protein
MVRKIKETKCTCSACGNTWYYGKEEVSKNLGAAMENLGKDLTCLSGCMPAVFIPDKKVIDLDKCPKCGSKAIKKEEVIHEV